MQDNRLDIAPRIDAFKQAWAETSGAPKDRTTLRETSKAIAWTSSSPLPLRRAIVATLVDDTDPAQAADARNMVRLMIPKEQSRGMMAFLCEACSTRGWTECAAELVRSYSRPIAEVPDEQRGERVALTTLFPDKKIEDIVFDMFLHPPAHAAAAPGDWTERLRSDCWDLLARLDSDGTFRASILMPSSSLIVDDPIVRDLRACASELKAVPLTGDELRWARSLHDPAKPDNTRWWGEAARAIASLSADQSKGLQLRHAEPIRWSSVHRPAWLAASRESLVNELTARLESRDHSSRSADMTSQRQPVRQDLAYWSASMRWGDLLEMLVVDDAIRQPVVVAELFRQGEADRIDTSTEMGGLIEPARVSGSSAEGVSDDQFRARLFRPRSSERRGDEQFVASDDMIAAADRATSLYHFHVQRWRNAEYAGPSSGDLLYAARSGRGCLVLTGVGAQRLNVDYYQPDGAVIDLGTIEARAK